MLQLFEKSIKTAGYSDYIPDTRKVFCLLAPSRLSAALILFIAFNTQAEARPRMCERLQVEINQLQQKLGNFNFNDPYQAAIEDQTIAINQVESQRAQQGCGSFNANMGVCENYGTTLAHMRENLALLKLEQKNMFSGNPTTKRYIEAKQKYNALNCANEFLEPTAGVQAPLPGGQPVNIQGTAHGNTYGLPPGGVPVDINAPLQQGSGGDQFGEPIASKPLAPLPSTSIQSSQPQNTNWQSPKTQTTGPTSGYKTMCVRSCDGYYFPINNNAQPTEFAEDEAICQSMCPSARSELYVYRTPGERLEDMRSLTGVPYRNHPNAFRFQNGAVAACGCEANPAQQEGIGQAHKNPQPSFVAGQPGTTLSNENPLANSTGPSEATGSITTAQQDGFGSLSGSVTKKNPTTDYRRWVEPKTGPIRRVGPKYFDDQ
ncbi:DUF2865 domain-containing protein [Polycladidibacter stylochi]|uniref:DUF2865 domain-containing protein n=1 Tax=Polycladidibacter stylochi TaxID=1807766 RepID=UPI000834E973|nr:DUF2865 domain-containing protein [Pseudovibrio stylochi]